MNTTDHETHQRLKAHGLNIRISPSTSYGWEWQVEMGDVTSSINWNQDADDAFRDALQWAKHYAKERDAE